MKQVGLGDCFLRYLFAICLFFLVFGVFWVGSAGGFIFDDYPTVVSNSNLHVTTLNISNLWQSALSFQPGGIGRPLSMATLAVNYAIDGLNPWGYKVGGLIIHALNTILIFYLSVATLRLGRCHEKHINWSAFAISLVWAIHPLQVSTALYVVQRMEMLSLTFVLLALLCYIRARSRQVQGRAGGGWLLFCLPLITLGVLAKESAILFFAYCAAYELILLRFSAEKSRIRRLWMLVYGAGLVLAFLVYIFYVIPHYSSSTTYTGRDFNTLERLLTQLRVIPLYLGQILLPLPGNMDFYYDGYPVSRGLFDPLSTMFCGVFLIALLVAAMATWRKMPLFTLGVMLFFFAHILTSNVIALELVFEHRNYFALFGVILAVATLVDKIPVRGDVRVKYLCVGAVIVAVAILGWVRAATWGDPLLLALQHATSNPDSARAAHAMGVIYHEMADGSTQSPFFDLAIREFERESELPHASILAEQSLILLNAQGGQGAENRWWAQLIHKLETQPVTPETTAAMFALADNHIKGVELDGEKVLDAFIVMFKRVRLPAHSYISVARYALETVGNEAVAENLLLYGVERSKSNPEYINSIILGLQRDGYDALADRVFSFAVDIGVPVDGVDVHAPKEITDEPNGLF